MVNRALLWAVGNPRLERMVTESRMARVLRTGSYAAVLTLTVAKVGVERFAGAAALAHQPPPAPSWLVRPPGARAPSVPGPGEDRTRELVGAPR